MGRAAGTRARRRRRPGAARPPSARVSYHQTYASRSDPSGARRSAPPHLKLLNDPSSRRGRRRPARSAGPRTRTDSGRGPPSGTSPVHKSTSESGAKHRNAVMLTETRRENLMYALNVTSVSSFSRRVSVYEKRFTWSTRMRGLCGNQPVILYAIEQTQLQRGNLISAQVDATSAASATFLISAASCTFHRLFFPLNPQQP